MKYILNKKNEKCYFINDEIDKIYFEIPFTIYFLARHTKTKKICLAKKIYSSDLITYSWIII
jgi:hypothetical protein